MVYYDLVLIAEMINIHTDLHNNFVVNAECKAICARKKNNV